MYCYNVIYLMISYDFILHSKSSLFFFFFFNDTATTEIYTLSLHDALPISESGFDDPARNANGGHWSERLREIHAGPRRVVQGADRKSTRLNSSHGYISYAVFCLKKKKK